MAQLCVYRVYSDSFTKTLFIPKCKSLRSTVACSMLLHWCTVDSATDYCRPPMCAIHRYLTVYSITVYHLLTECNGIWWSAMISNKERWYLTKSNVIIHYTAIDSIGMSMLQWVVLYSPVRAYYCNYCTQFGSSKRLQTQPNKDRTSQCTVLRATQFWV